MRRLLLRLYPARWRERYGDEFAAVLEERPLGPSDVADVLHGALDAHLRLRGQHNLVQSGKGPAMSTRLWGYAAMGGGLLWSAGLFGSMFDPSGRPWAMSTAFGVVPFPAPWAEFVIAGTALLLAALVGLSSLQARRHPRLIWASFLLPAIGLVVSFIGLLGMQVLERPSLFDAFDIWTLGALGVMGGSALFATATWHARALSRAAAVVLLIASSVMIGTLVGGTTNLTRGLMKESWWLGFFYLALVAFGAGWIGLGWSAIRSARPLAPDPGSTRVSLG